MKILALNPSKRKKTTRKKRATKARTKPRIHKKGVRVMSKKRRGRSRKLAKTRTKREVVVVNPPRRRRYARRAKSAMDALGIVDASRAFLPMMGGAIAAKLVQKKFGDGTPESGNWTARDYFMGGLGAVGASLVTRHVLRGSTATANNVLKGGLLIIGFKLLTQELVPMSDAASQWLGEDGKKYSPGDIYESETGESFILGNQGQWTEADTDRMLPARTTGQDEVLIGSELTTPGPLGLGDELTTPGPLGDAWSEAMAPTTPGRGPVW